MEDEEEILGDEPLLVEDIPEDHQVVSEPSLDKDMELLLQVAVVHEQVPVVVSALSDRPWPGRLVWPACCLGYPASPLLYV